jgi:hypothetical protein
VTQSFKLALCAIGLAAFGGAAAAQTPAPAQGAAAPAAEPAGRPAPPANARAGAPIDLTGQWVAVITEDWRWRMVTPAKGDFASLPLNAEGRRVAYQWDLAADNAAGNQCRAFGAGGLMRIPMRIRISWQDDNTLKLETDAGQQTRLYRFVAPAPGGDHPALRVQTPPTGERTWQGEIKAQWFRQPQSRGLGFGGVGQLTGGAMRAVTRNMRAGYLRKNGIPYSEDATISEQFNLHGGPRNEQWITITTLVEDPKYLTTPFITSTSFRKETAPGGWNPTPCATATPLAREIPPPAPPQPRPAAPTPAR